MDTKKPLRNILIIDDDDDFRKLMLSWLTSQFQDIEVVEYDPLSQGVPYKNLDWSTFDVLLLDYDLQLGGVTGLDILQDCYDNLLFPTTIMLTGAGNEETKVRALQLGVADYLRKEQLTKEEIKAAMDNAFAQQCSKRKHLYILNDAMQVAQSESKKIIEVYKTQYDQEREQEVKSLKAELEKSQEELIKSQEMLATFEEDHKNAEVEKSKLLAEIHKLKVQQSNATEEVDIETKLESTQDGLMRVNTSIKKSNRVSIMQKLRWKRPGGNRIRKPLNSRRWKMTWPLLCKIRNNHPMPEMKCVSDWRCLSVMIRKKSTQKKITKHYSMTSLHN